MYIDAHTIITAGSVLAAATAIFALVFKIYRWVLKQDRQDAELSAWYIKWLDVTRTRVISDRPSWLDEL